MMRKIFAAAGVLGFAAASHSHHSSTQTHEVKGYPAVGFPINSIVEYVEQQVNHNTMMVGPVKGGYTVVSYYDYTNGRLLD